MFYSIEISEESLPAWKLSGRERGEFLHIQCGEAQGWVRKDTIARIAFPTLGQTYRLTCQACENTTVVISAQSIEHIQIILREKGVLCPACSKMDQAGRIGR